MKEEEKVLFRIAKLDDETSSVNTHINGKEDAYMVAHGIVQLLKSLPALSDLIIEVFRDEMLAKVSEFEMPDFDKILKEAK